MIKRLKTLFNNFVDRYFDYKITGEYYDSYYDKTSGIYTRKKKYNK